MPRSLRERRQSLVSPSPIAEASIVRDLEEADDYEAGEEIRRWSSMNERGHRPSLPWPTPLPPVYVPVGGPEAHDGPSELASSSPATTTGLLGRLKYHLGLGGPRSAEENAQNSAEGAEPSETSALLSNGQQQDNGERTTAWEDAGPVKTSQTTWQREAKLLTSSSGQLVTTSVLQYSLTAASIFAVGHIGKLELGAASLASMTANITGYVVYYGLATSLDTLSAQAYGSGRRGLLGLQLQRMVYFLWGVTIPIGILWLNMTPILTALLPDPELARLAGLYLRVILIGTPAVAAFEGGKRFVLAQGMFNAPLFVLLVCAPANAFLCWLFVWRLDWGYIGAPAAVTVIDYLMTLLLFVYVYFSRARECWDGLTLRAFKNWGPMIRLALPGLAMIEAEALAFETLTLAAGYLSTTELAAQAVLANLVSLTFQVPMSLSIAASNRVANLLGANLAQAAKMSSTVILVGALVVGSINMIFLWSLRDVLAPLFTNDPDVARLIRQTLPLCAAFQLFDSMSTNYSGVLRGLGRQSFGGWVNLGCYYVIGLPISFGTAFGLHWGLSGLWAGVGLALFLVSLIEGWYVYRTRWDEVVQAANDRNNLG